MLQKEAQAALTAGYLAGYMQKEAAWYDDAIAKAQSTWEGLGEDEKRQLMYTGGGAALGAGAGGLADGWGGAAAGAVLGGGAGYGASYLHKPVAKKIEEFLAARKAKAESVDRVVSGTLGDAAANPMAKPTNPSLSQFVKDIGASKL